MHLLHLLSNTNYTVITLKIKSGTWWLTQKKEDLLSLSNGKEHKKNSIKKILF